MKHAEVRRAKLVFRGTDIQPSAVLRELARGTSLPKLRGRWPALTADQLIWALRQGAEALAREEPTSSQLGKHLEIKPGVCYGQLIFKGTRVPVRTVLTFLGKSQGIADVRQDWPQLSTEAIADAVRRAARALTRQEIAREPARPG